jgi:hypothetical protein
MIGISQRGPFSVGRSKVLRWRRRPPSLGRLERWEDKYRILGLLQLGIGQKGVQGLLEGPLATWPAKIFGVVLLTHSLMIIVDLLTDSAQGLSFTRCSSTCMS